MRVLVTGANGLIGANLIRELLISGHQVRALVRPDSDVSSLTGLDIEKVSGDVLHVDSLDGVAQGCDVIFHCAAMFSYWEMNARELENLAVDGTRNVINAAHASGVTRIVLTSSSVVLGSTSRPLVLNEAHQLDDHDTAPYTIAKALQEQHAFEHAAELGIELIAVCPTMSIGPHGYRLGPSNGLIVSYLNDFSKATFPGGCNIVSVKDVARGHIIAAEKGKPGERYILGSENLEWSAIHEMISELCGIDGPSWQVNHTASYLTSAVAEISARFTGETPLITRAQARMVGRYYWYDHGKISELGYKPQSARSAMARAISWLITSPHVSRQVRMSLRITREVYQARKIMASAAETIEMSK